MPLSPFGKRSADAIFDAYLEELNATIEAMRQTIMESVHSQTGFNAATVNVVTDSLAELLDHRRHVTEVLTDRITPEVITVLLTENVGSPAVVAAIASLPSCVAPATPQQGGVDIVDVMLGYLEEFATHCIPKVPVPTRAVATLAAEEAGIRYTEEYGHEFDGSPEAVVQLNNVVKAMPVQMVRNLLLSGKRTA